jgi:hypothetical protein
LSGVLFQLLNDSDHILPGIDVQQLIPVRQQYKFPRESTRVIYVASTTKATK